MLQLACGRKSKNKVKHVHCKTTQVIREGTETTEIGNIFDVYEKFDVGGPAAF